MDSLISLLMYWEPDDPVVTQYVACSAVFLEIVAVIGVALLVLTNEPLRKRKRPQDRLIFWECVLVFVMNVQILLMYALVNLHPTWWVGVFFVTLTVYDILYMLTVLQWMICVDYNLHHSMDHIHRRYRYAGLPILLLVLISIMNSVIAFGMVDSGAWGFYAQYVLTILERVIEFCYIFYAIHLVHDYEKGRREPRFLRLDVFIVPFLLGVLFRHYDAPCIALGVILTYAVMKRRDKYIESETGLFNAAYLDCVSAHWDKKGYSDTSALLVSAPGNGENLAKILQDIRVQDCFIIRMETDRFVILTKELRDSAIKMLEMTVLEETQQSDTPFVPVMCSMERETGQSAVEFADKIKESLCR